MPQHTLGSRTNTLHTYIHSTVVLLTIHAGRWNVHLISGTFGSARSFFLFFSFCSTSLAWAYWMMLMLRGKNINGISANCISTVRPIDSHTVHHMLRMIFPILPITYANAICTYILSFYDRLGHPHASHHEIKWLLQPQFVFMNFSNANEDSRKFRKRLAKCLCK